MTISTNRLSARDNICDVIRRELIGGKFDFDQPIREQKLASRFGTSRGPVRDALLRLTQEGILVYETNKGVRVNSPLSEEERSVVVAMRLHLEKFCLKKFLPLATDSDFGQISILLERLTSACDRASLPEVAECDLALHRYWVARASPHLESTWLGLSVRMIMKYSRLSDYDQIREEHDRIVRAILDRNLTHASLSLEANVI